MTIELTSQQVYGGIVILLLILQVWHHYRLSKHINQTEIHLGQIWIQITTLTTSIAHKLTELEKKVNERVGKQDKTT